MENTKTKETKSSRSGLVIAIILPVLAVLALLFVYWIGFASFEGNAVDIYRQSYSTILSQSVSEIESGVRNGKMLESYFGIDRLLYSTAEFIRDDAHTAVTGPQGELLYETFDIDSGYAALLEAEQVRLVMEREDGSRESMVAEAGGFEFLVQPIYAPDGSQSGNLCAIYPARSEAMFAAQRDALLSMTLIVAGTVVAAVLIWLLISARKRDKFPAWLLTAMPVIIITLGIAIQGILSFFTYQSEYRRIMLGSAHTACHYIGALVNQVHEKGVPYDRMYGLDHFFAEKLEQMQGLWEIKLVTVLADSRDVLEREDEFRLSMPIAETGGYDALRLDVTISSEYINDRMLEAMLLSMITLIISIVAVIEIMRLPELMSLRASGDFGKPVQRQNEGIQSALRLCTFLLYTGAYVVMPYSAVLVRQWRQTLFGLSLDVTAGIPMSVEIFALMIGGLVCAALFKRLNVKIGLGAAAVLFVLANVACLFIRDPLSLAALRFMSGIGFSGILYTSNYIVSYGTSGGSGGRGAALANVNAGLLGGIMAGGALGAVIAGTMGIEMCFTIAASLCVASGVILFMFIPWKMLKDNSAEAAAAKAVEDSKALSDKTAEKAIHPVRALLHPRVLLYFLLVMAPLSFGLMFIVAGMPAFVSMSGLSPLLLSCGFLANGVAGVYLGRPLLKSLTRLLRGNTLLAAVLITGGVAIGFIFLPPAWLTLIICAFLLGIFDGVGTPTAMQSFTELPGISQMRPVDALAVGNTFTRAVNTAAPLLYGAIIASAAGSMIIFAIIGAAFMAVGVLHIFISKIRFARPGEIGSGA